MPDMGNARLVEVPSDEGVIDRSLAELDVKLAEWTNATRKIQATLATRAETAERSEQHDGSEHEGRATTHGTAPSAGGEGDTERSACEEADGPPSGKTQANEEASGSVDSSDLSRLRVLFEKKPAAVRHEAEQIDDATHEVQTETENQREPQPSFGAEAEANEAEGSDGESPTAREEENILLASLDPKTRRDIHVLRRISDERKSIHQLLEEYRAAQARQSEAQAQELDKRSWWRLSR